MQKIRKILTAVSQKTALPTNQLLPTKLILYDLADAGPKKWVLDLKRENWRADSVTTSFYLSTENILIRQHFQVTCGTWKVFQIKWNT